MDIVDEDITGEDFENVLLNQEEAKSYLRRLKEDCSNYAVRLERDILELISKSSGEIVVYIFHSSLINKYSFDFMLVTS